MDPALQREIETVNKFRAINEATLRGDSAVQQFYNGCTALVSGGSGFLGKQLIDKLIRSTEIKRIYILIREKKNKTIWERIATVTEDPVFDTLRKTKPDFASKLVPIKGDVSELRLGLSDDDWTKITNEVEIIIHGAATVNFDEPLKFATLINIRGTREMLELGKACKKLKSYVHISTAFAHATRSRINEEVLEKFYKSPVPPQTMIEMAESMDEKRLNDVTASLIQDWPNTYTFTKAIAEEAVRTLGRDLPICIVRPAIVVASYREPAPGWLDTSSALGPSGFIIGVGLGIVHTVLSSANIKVDLVPVDLVNNAVVAAAWHTAERRARGDTEINIYTVTNHRNSVYFQYLSNFMIKDVGTKYPTPLAVWYTFVMFTQNKYLYFLLNLLWHVIPAHVADAVCWVIGKPRKFVKLLNKAGRLNDVLSYFTCNQWKSSDRNLRELHSSLSKDDEIIYNSNVSIIDWPEYLTVWAIGIRKYVLKDNLQGTQVAYRKQYWFRIAHYIFAVLYFYVLYKVLYATFWTVNSVVSLVI